MSRIALIACLTLTACGIGSGGVSAPSSALLGKHDIARVGPTVIEPIEIGDVRDSEWALNLEVSQRIGLDFSDLSGASAELHTTPVAGDFGEGMRAHILVFDGTVRGAWLSAQGMSGVLPLTATR